jgi:hypothetical protein
MWQYGGGATAVHKNLQYLQNIAADPAAASALSFFCIHGYDSDGTTATGSSATAWDWWLNGWKTSPGAGVPAPVKGTSAYGKKSWMTETSGEAPGWLAPTGAFPNQGAWSIALKLHQALTAGQQSAWAYWQLTDGKTVAASTLTDSTQRTKAAKYIAAKHFFRFIRPNSLRVNVSVTNAPGLNASAFLAPSNTALTVVLVNAGTNSLNIKIPAPSLPVGLKSFQSFTSDANALWVSNSVPIVGGTATLNVPGYGVCTLFGRPASVGTPPAITDLPQSADVGVGTTVRLSCAATGDAPLSFQWFFNNLPIPGATATVLSLTNIQPYQAGQYGVQVSNSVGSVISLPATLKVTGQATLPEITPHISTARSGDGLQLSFVANPGRVYSWMVATNPNSWSVASSFVSPTSLAKWLVLPSLFAPPRYFRVSSP